MTTVSKAIIAPFHGLRLQAPDKACTLWHVDAGGLYRNYAQIALALAGGAVLALTFAPSSFGEVSNPFRDHVKAREAAHIARLRGRGRPRNIQKTPRIVGGIVSPDGKWPRRSRC